MLKNIDAKSLEKTLKVLANRRRLKILQLLRNKEEFSVGSIAESINLSYKSTSRHLAILYSAEFVDREQRSSEVYYRLSLRQDSIEKKMLMVL